MMQNGVYSTQNISECRKTGRGVLLSDILEDDVDQKYFLSKEQTERIIFADSSDTGADTDEIHRFMAGGGIIETLDTCQGGGREPHTIEVMGYTRESDVKDRTRILSVGGGKSIVKGNRSQRPSESGVECIGNINPSGKGMNGNCYSPDGINPTLTTNKGEGNKVAVSVVGYNATLKIGGHDGNGTCTLREGSQRTIGRQSDDDGGGNMFAIDKGIRPEEREIANCIESREDRGLSKRKQEGTLICYKMEFPCQSEKQRK